MYEFVIGCDNAAINLKNALIDHLKDRCHFHDLGCATRDDPVNYPTIASLACNEIINSGYTKRGILICGTGIGMAISANKFPGIRAAVCHDGFSADRSILSNDVNVMCFGERVIGVELAKKIAREWIDLKYIDGPSTPKILEIFEIEAKNMKNAEILRGKSKWANTQ